MRKFNDSDKERVLQYSSILDLIVFKGLKMISLPHKDSKYQDKSKYIIFLLIYYLTSYLLPNKLIRISMVSMNNDSHIPICFAYKYTQTHIHTSQRRQVIPYVMVHQ